MDTSFRLMPEQASTFAPQVDLLYAFLLLVSGLLSVGIAGTIVWFAIKYRRKSTADRRQTPSHMLLLELSWIVGPFVLSMILFVWGAKLFFHQTHAVEGALEVNCVGRQWMWKFQHPNGRSEINDLHVPLNQPVKINMISEDVIHSLYIPAFRVKQDVLPGRYTSIWFEASKVGQYHLFCAEYCGVKHSGMIGVVHVLEPARYQEWLSDQSGGASLAGGSGRLFDQLRCNSCHLAGGEVSRGPSLVNLLGRTVPLQNGQKIVADENYIRESILRPAAKIVAGYQPLMPSFEGQVSEEGILQLIAEIKAMGQPEGRGPQGASPITDKPAGPGQTPSKPADQPEAVPKK
ncbi:MAG: cytochrome c oxidase subunit II [Planctomycetota bacterium]